MTLLSLAAKYEKDIQHHLKKQASENIFIEAIRTKPDMASALGEFYFAMRRIFNEIYEEIDSEVNGIPEDPDFINPNKEEWNLRLQKIDELQSAEIDIMQEACSKLMAVDKQLEEAYKS